jgi:hypothetical protein
MKEVEGSKVKAVTSLDDWNEVLEVAKVITSDPIIQSSIALTSLLMVSRVKISYSWLISMQHGELNVSKSSNNHTVFDV